MAIITRANYKTYAGISGTAFDSQLDVIIAAVEDAARRKLGRNMSDGLESATRTEDYEEPTASLQLREFPLTSVTSITPINDDNSLGDAIDSDTYNVDLRTGIVKLNGAYNGRTFYDDDNGPRTGWGWVPAFGRVRVVYVSAAAESDLVLALYRMVDGSFASIKMNPAIQSQSVGQWSITYRDAASAVEAQMALLAPFDNAGWSVV